jgi:cell wall-associated NlpC family hydrolase
MKRLINFVIGCLLIGVSSAADSAAPTVKSGSEAGEIRVVPASDPLLAKAAERGDIVGRLIKAARRTIGVRYKWGGTQMEEGIDCSNYTWQLYHSLGMGYDRFLSTMALSRVNRTNGLHKIPFEDALAGDLLIYGYRDEAKRWRGHVVILVDKDGATTGHRGLVLGAHGGSVDEVQYVTFTGFDKGYFKDPRMRLVNVLRVDGTHAKSDAD